MPAVDTQLGVLGSLSSVCLPVSQSPCLSPRLSVCLPIAVCLKLTEMMQRIASEKHFSQSQTGDIADIDASLL